ncbi:MAG: hypothetical protein KJ941_03945, partial [Bacteroidetes bacterium]|nr:hypothetical protein [Bacteroidota bacterium]
SFLCRCLIENKSFDEASNLILEIRNLGKEKGFNSTDIEVKIFTHSFQLEIKLLQSKGEFEKAVDLFDLNEKKQKEFGDKINKEQEVLFFYYRAYACFGIGEFKRALQYLNEVLNDNETNLRQDIYAFARVLNLILHYELENYDFLEYIIKSTNRFISKNERTMISEAVIVKYLRKLSKTPLTQEQVPLLDSFNAEITALYKNENERVLTEYFNLNAWIESKLKKISLGQAVKHSIE